MLLSVITVNYNNSEGLLKTLSSVASQSCTDFEHIIVDGGSTDISPMLIRNYANESSFPVHWISEPDRGIYNAMNKGVRMSHGDYLLFLNSGDVLYDSEVVKRFYESKVVADIATGVEIMPNGTKILPPNDNRLTYEFFYEDTLLHQSTFIRKDAFERFGPYREDYRIVSDWEWFFRAIIRDGATYQPLDFIVAVFDDCGISNNSDYSLLHKNEREQVHTEILPRVRPDYFELQRLRKVELEYKFLKNGRFGFIVKLLLAIKSLK